MSSGRVWLRSVVRNAQLALIDAGHLKVTSDISKAADGQFGPGTEKAVKAFQGEKKLARSGVLDRASWDRLEVHVRNALGDRELRTAELLTGFRGDLDWVHEKEGHRGRPYWPEGKSGVTLDPGVDVGHAAPDLVENLYRPLLTAAQLDALRQVFGLRGQAAADALQASAELAAIRITNSQAVELMPFAARNYWREISDRFKALRRKRTLPSVQTALLSLAYNRGAGNGHLESLGELLEGKRWSDVSAKIAAMQQSHEQPGIRSRRREEGALIQAELEFLE
jgi:peptidoglycan hydrolase-like protein with peptidoglycan-binding domain